MSDLTRGATSTATTEGMGTGTKVAIGLGAAAVVGGGVALVVGLSDEDSGSSGNECYIDSQLDVADGGIIYTSEGNRCDIWMSWGRWSIEEVNSVLSEMFYEAIVNNTSLQPLTPLGIHQAGDGYDIHQTFRTDVLQKGSHNVMVIYRRNQSIIHTKQFTIQVD